MNRGVDRQAVFFTDTDRLEFGRRLVDIHERFGVETIAYCLMDNHYHLLLHSADGQLSRSMHHLGTTYTTRTNRRRGRDGPIFRGRFHSIPVETDTYLTWSARYIHRNPLDIARVQHIAAYRWSSYRAYLGHRQTASFLNADILLGMFGNDRSQLAEFTEGPCSIDLTSDRAITDLVQLVEFEIARDDLVHGSDASPRPHQARTVLVLLSDQVRRGPLGAAIEAHLDIPNPTARRKAIGRARTRLARDPSITRIVSAMLDHLDIRRAA